ncbi:helix-turn-helix domain-containing protein [Salipiger marinus]|uniref:helix-turn-helix domain-containing protein n=1 Tax=Salipiger marinus TaxID=555512 RepID=UPI002C0F0A02|nr:helix-turn-helix domain-containing protein [Salipiger manganoxidans]MEB3419925.1 helix-turn-helix domain-containing protein [Salipiger manganoxidans]
MSIKIMSQVWETGPEDRSELLVMLALADFSNDAGECWPSMKSIAAKARMTERGVQKILSRLEASGRISVQTGGGRHGCNVYKIHPGNPERGRGNPEPHSPNTSAETPNTVHPERGSPRTPVQKPRTGVQKTPNGGSPEPSRTVIEPSSSSSSAREALTDDQLYDEVMAAAGIRNGQMPSHWLPPAATIHVSRWRSQLGLSDAEILATVRESRRRHDTPPNGPKGLDGAMQRTAGAKVVPLKPAVPYQFSKPDDRAKRRAFYEDVTRRYGGSTE